MMQLRIRLGVTLLSLAVGFLEGSGTPALGQVIERETSVTGPRGKTIDRKVRTERSNGTIHRELDISRPGGTLHREATIQGPRAAGAMRPPMPGPRPGPGPGPRFGPGPGYGYGRGGPVFIERNIIVDRRPNNTGAAIGGFAAGTALGLVVGNAMAPPPPPVY